MRRRRDFGELVCQRAVSEEDKERFLAYIRGFARNGMTIRFKEDMRGCAKFKLGLWQADNELFNVWQQAWPVRLRNDTIYLYPSRGDMHAAAQTIDAKSRRRDRWKIIAALAAAAMLMAFAYYTEDD